MEIGNFTIEKELGEGSFGRTFLAKHNTLGYYVVVKQEKTAAEPSISLFRDEARLLQQARHFGLPSLIDYYETEEFGQIMILSYIEGTILAKIKPITDEHICWILDRIFSILSYMHGHMKVVHADVKPENMIVDIPNHMVNLIDLGMGVQNANPKTKAKGGTPGYMPPEFEAGFPPIPESDIYSTAKVASFLAGGDPMLGTLPMDMNPDLKNFINRMMIREPQKRGRADDLRKELHNIRCRNFGPNTKDAIKYR